MSIDFITTKAIRSVRKSEKPGHFGTQCFIVEQFIRQSVSQHRWWWINVWTRRTDEYHSNHLPQLVTFGSRSVGVRMNVFLSDDLIIQRTNSDEYNDDDVDAKGENGEMQIYCRKSVSGSAKRSRRQRDMYACIVHSHLNVSMLLLNDNRIERSAIHTAGRRCRRRAPGSRNAVYIKSRRQTDGAYFSETKIKSFRPKMKFRMNFHFSDTFSGRRHSRTEIHANK